MQTFLPLPSFDRSARVLDSKRLAKQRVEAFQILRAVTDPEYGWQHHPAVKMWRGCPYALALYGEAIHAECVRRGIADNTDMGARISAYKKPNVQIYYSPGWLGMRAFHKSHKSNLIRKDAEHYQPLWPNVPADLPYVWPTTGF